MRGFISNVSRISMWCPKAILCIPVYFGRKPWRAFACSGTKETRDFTVSVKRSNEVSYTCKVPPFRRIAANIQIICWEYSSSRHAPLPPKSGVWRYLTPSTVRSGQRIFLPTRPINFIALLYQIYIALHLFIKPALNATPDLLSYISPSYLFSIISSIYFFCKLCHIFKNWLQKKVNEKNDLRKN